MVYPGRLAMTKEDAAAIDKLNADSGWGISRQELEELCDQHKAAFTACLETKGPGEATEFIRIMEKIEYRLTDCNFHTECKLLRAGKYAEALLLT